MLGFGFAGLARHWIVYPCVSVLFIVVNAPQRLTLALSQRRAHLAFDPHVHCPLPGSAREGRSHVGQRLDHESVSLVIFHARDHADSRLTPFRSSPRYKFFTLFTTGSFIWFWFPDYLCTSLSSYVFPVHRREEGASAASHGSGRSSTEGAARVMGILTHIIVTLLGLLSSHGSGPRTRRSTRYSAAALELDSSRFPLTGPLSAMPELLSPHLCKLTSRHQPGSHALLTHLLGSPWFASSQLCHRQMLRCRPFLLRVHRTDRLLHQCLELGLVRPAGSLGLNRTWG